MDVLITETVSFAQKEGIVKSAVGGSNMVISLVILEEHRLEPLLPATVNVTEYTPELVNVLGAVKPVGVVVPALKIHVRVNCDAGKGAIELS